MRKYYTNFSSLAYVNQIYKHIRLLRPVYYLECVCDLLKRYAGAKSLGTDSNMQDFWKFWLIDDIKQSYRKTYLPLMQKTAAVQRKIRTFVYSLRYVMICDHNKSYCVFITPLILEL